jgi:hypothetical protein
MKGFLERCYRLLRRPIDSFGLLGSFALVHSLCWGVFQEALNYDTKDLDMAPSLVFLLISIELLALYLSLKLARFNSERMSPYFGDTDDLATHRSTSRITTLLGLAVLIALFFTYILERLEPQRPSTFSNAARHVGQS